MTDQTTKAAKFYPIALEDHITEMASGARALWRAMDNDLIFWHRKDAAALCAMAGRLLEHAEHTRGLFENGGNYLERLMGAAVAARALWRALEADDLFRDVLDARALREMALRIMSDAEDALDLLECPRPAEEQGPGGDV